MESFFLLIVIFLYFPDPCKKWPDNYFEKFDEPNSSLLDEMYTYGRENLALIHVVVQSPYIICPTVTFSCIFCCIILSNNYLLFSLKMRQNLTNILIIGA